MRHLLIALLMLAAALAITAAGASISQNASPNTKPVGKTTD
jgi:hypothetical protein